MPVRHRSVQVILTRRLRVGRTVYAFVFGLLLASCLRAESAPKQDLDTAKERLKIQQSEMSAEEKSGLMNLLEIMDKVVVTSATNTAEKLSQTPATVIVITRRELEERGVTSVAELLNGLPGIDVTWPYGDAYVKSYWRGFRMSHGECFLLMVDGMVINKLWNQNADGALISLPLANVERIEVVYGPASAVYGANAFMGVMNVITRKEALFDGLCGLSGNINAGTGSFENRHTDFNTFFAGNSFRLSVSGRFSSGDLDEDAGERYEYTSRRYLTNKNIFGRLLDFYPGKLSSPYRTKGVSVQAFYGNFEAGFQFLDSQTGAGLEYPADRYLPASYLWDMRETGLYVKHQNHYGEVASSTATVRFRRSDHTVDSLEHDVGYVMHVGRATPGGPYVIMGQGFEDTVQRYPSINSSLAFNWDWEFHFRSQFSMNAGVSVEQKTLQKKYGFSNPNFDAVPVQSYDPSNPIVAAALADPPLSLSDSNHFSVQDRGFFVQSFFRPAVDHLLILGLRSDYNGIYGTSNTFRGGYVGTFGNFVLKGLVGQAYQEPTARQLYGAWAGAGSSTTLRPERSTTTEIIGTYTQKQFSALLSAWNVKNSDTVMSLQGGAVNLGTRNISGLDLHLKAQSADRRIDAWAYYSRVFHADEDQVDASGRINGTVGVGDISKHKLWLGTTLRFTEDLTLTLQARRIGDRPTVSTNPAGNVKAYTNLDCFFLLKHLGLTGFSCSLKVTNVLDEKYATPGIMSGNAGFTPGAMVPITVSAPDGTNLSTSGWRGSGGYYSSLLPQPGRAFLLTLGYEF